MPAPATGTILLVDDEDAVRVLIRRQLAALGHTVLEASHGAEAMGLLRMRHGAVDLLLSDVVMPEMNGTELAATVGREFPGLPIILMSAYAPAGLTRVGFDDLVVPILQKPLAYGQLAEMVRVALEVPDRLRGWRRPASL